jgi:hypothetical protein
VRIVALSRAPFGSDAAVFFPCGGDAAGGEESLVRLPICRVRVWFYWIQIEFELLFSFHSFFVAVDSENLDLHPRLGVYRPSENLDLHSSCL